MRCTTCFSPDHEAAQCTAFRAQANVRRVKCPSCWSSITPDELALHKAEGCHNVRRPRRIAEVRGGDDS